MNRLTVVASGGGCGGGRFSNILPSELSHLTCRSRWRALWSIILKSLHGMLLTISYPAFWLLFFFFFLSQAKLYTLCMRTVIIDVLCLYLRKRKNWQCPACFQNYGNRLADLLCRRKFQMASTVQHTFPPNVHKFSHLCM